MASNTGCTSLGELAMTFRISAVAVCRSSASRVSLNSRTFSIAMTAWSAKVCSSWTWWADKRTRFLARDVDRADRRPVAHQGGEQHAAKTAQSRYIPQTRFRFGIDDLCNLAVADQLKRRKLGQRPRERRLQGFVGRCRRRCECRQVTDATGKAQHRGREAADQPVGTGRDGLEHRLHVRWRSGDDLQDVGGRGLPLQRLLASR